eukprot:2542102-Prymnesium_polylepis.1
MELISRGGAEEEQRRSRGGAADLQLLHRFVVADASEEWLMSSCRASELWLSARGSGVIRTRARSAARATAPNPPTDPRQVATH